MNASSISPVRQGALKAWELSWQGARVTVAEQGAQVLSYQPERQAKVLWLSEQATGQRGQSQRGGVPVCWPWFGVFEQNPSAVRDTFTTTAPLPAHGLARDRDWTVLDTTINSRYVEMRLGLTLSAPPLHTALRAELRLRLSEHLSLELHTHNLGDQGVTLSAALHSYLAISHIHQIAITGLEGAPYYDALDRWSVKSDDQPLRIQGETDRVYTGLHKSIQLHDAGWGRRIVLTPLQSQSAVLWNPWIDKATRLSEFAPDAWQRMVCIETARVMDDCLVLAPGQSDAFGVILSAELERLP